MPINRLISIIDEQSMLEVYVIIDFIDYQFLSIINTNRSVNKSDKLTELNIRIRIRIKY